MEEEIYLMCLLDVLGFENLFAKYGLNEIEKKYLELLEVVEKQGVEFAIASDIDGSMLMGSPGIKYAYFSDTVILWCKYDSFRMNVLFGCMCELICKSIEIGMPLRGAFSVGTLCINKEKGVFLGQPIITAARAESVQKWIGITLSSSFDIKPYDGGFRTDQCLEYDKHIKEGGKEKVFPLVLDYPRHWRLTRNSSLIDEINKLNTNTQYEDYYKNTIDFVRYSKEKHDWWKVLPEYKLMMEDRANKGRNKDE